MLKKRTIQLTTLEGKDTYLNITDAINDFIKETGLESGLCHIISPHTTCSVFYEEYSHDRTEDGEEFLLADLSDVLEKLVPAQTSPNIYRYPGQDHLDAVRSWPNADQYLPTNQIEDLWNGDAHLKSSIVGNSLALDVEDGQLNIGSTGSVYFVDFDRTRDRQRKCQLILIAE